MSRRKHRVCAAIHGVFICLAAVDYLGRPLPQAVSLPGRSQPGRLCGLLKLAARRSKGLTGRITPIGPSVRRIVGAPSVVLPDASADSSASYNFSAESPSLAARFGISLDLVSMLPVPEFLFNGGRSKDLDLDPEEFVEISDPENISIVPEDPRDEGFVQEDRVSVTGALAAMGEVVWNRATCFGEGCRVAAWNAAMHGRSGALSAWNAAMRSEGWIVYNLFRRQLSILFPSFQRAAQLRADLFFERAFWLRNLTASPAAFSVLLGVLPAGLNFTSCYISDVRVSWSVDPRRLGRIPIVVDVETVVATAGEVPAGGHEEVEDIISTWLEIGEGLDKDLNVKPFPFQGRYPLLDGATFRCRKLELDIISPARYGNVSVLAEDLEVRAVDSKGQVQDLDRLCEEGLSDHTVTFCRLFTCSTASIRYINENASSFVNATGNDSDHGNEQLTAEFMLAPTPFGVLSSTTKSKEDMYRVVQQRWKYSFPGPLSITTLPPFLSEDAPELPAGDRRLYPYEAPAAEWTLEVAQANPLWGIQAVRPLYKRTRFQLAIGVVLAACALRLLQRLLS